MQKDFTVHRAAALFPMMTDAELAALADDIKANGLAQPIIVMGNEILDGRNRLAACKLAGVEPDYKEEHPENVYQFVTSMNVHRRHLTTSQRAEIAARMATLPPGPPKGSRNASKLKVQNCTVNFDRPPTLDEAAKMMGVSRRSVASAKAKFAGNDQDKPKQKRKAKQKAEPKPEGYVSIAQRYGLLGANTGSDARAKVRDQLSAITGFPIGRVSTFEEAAAIEAAAITLCTQRDSGFTAKEIRDARDSLKESQHERFDKAIAKARAALDGEFNKRVTTLQQSYQDEVNRRVNELMDDKFKEERARLKDALAETHEELLQWKRRKFGVAQAISKSEFKLVLNCLHPDRAPEDRRDKYAQAFGSIKKLESWIDAFDE